MKNGIFTLLVVTFSTTAISGEYSNYCFDKGYHKQEVPSCLEKIEEASKKRLRANLAAIQRAASEHGSSAMSVSNEDLNRMSYAFENYVDAQCSLIGSAVLGTGSWIESYDCKIKLLRSRIKDVEYLLSQHYK